MIKQITRPISLASGSSTIPTLVYALCMKKDSEVGLVIKTGAGSAAHSVRGMSDRYEFYNLSPCILKSIPIYYSEGYLLTYHNLMDELETLSKMRGIPQPTNLLLFDPSVIIVTEYHKHLSWTMAKLMEKNKGSCGSGSGKAFLHAKMAPEGALYAKDLKDVKVIEQKLRNIRWWASSMISNVTIDNFKKEEDKDTFRKIQAVMLETTNLELKRMVRELRSLGEKMYLATLPEVLQKFGCEAIIEQTHGVLADSEKGFKPYVSGIRTLPQLFDKKLKDAGYTGEIMNIAVHRAYEYQHGPGPMPTFVPGLMKKIGISKKTNSLRGASRAGLLDLPRMKYAIDICGGPKYFNGGLCISCFDHILSAPSCKVQDVNRTGEKPVYFEKREKVWTVCNGYLCDGNAILSKRKKKIELDTDMLMQKPPALNLVTTQHVLPDLRTFEGKAGEQAMFSFVKEALAEHLDVPVTILSYGTGAKRTIWG